MPDLAGRRRAVSAALLAAALFVSILPSVAQASAPPGLERFLSALGSLESGGSYTARNASSGAYGKYQIMPNSWAGWATQYLGGATAAQTPTNQEIVAHRKVTALYNWLDAWPAVGHWWLTGSGERNPAYWSSFSRTYVNRLMALMGGVGATTGKAQTTSSKSPAVTRLSETSNLIAYSQSWSSARYSGYAGDHVRYATRTDASATITFTGKTVTWIGPVGPTRGTARVFIDGKAAGKVDLRRSTFDSRSALFSKTFGTVGRHTMTIVVTSSGRPVAIDEILVGS